MSAVGRLWRRAPAWRLCLTAAIVFTALAAMFAPTLPHWPLAQPTPGDADPGPAAADGAAHYLPQPDAAPRDYETVESPPFGTGRTGVIPFAGRLLPLLAGTWQELTLARDGGAAAVQVAFFGRIEDRRVTGLLLAAAPDPLSRMAAPMAGLAPCFAADAIAHQIVPSAPGQSPMVHECWTLAAFDINDAALRSRLDDVMRAGFDRLDRLDLTVPDPMLALRYLRSDETGWFTALLLLPDRHGEIKSAAPRLQTWVRHFVTQLHKGFDGTLSAGEFAAAMAHDPE